MVRIRNPTLSNLDTINTFDHLADKMRLPLIISKCSPLLMRTILTVFPLKVSQSNPESIFIVKHMAGYMQLYAARITSSENSATKFIFLSQCQIVFCCFKFLQAEYR